MDQLPYAGWSAAHHSSQQQSSCDVYESRIVEHPEYDCVAQIDHLNQPTIIASSYEPYNFPIYQQNSNFKTSSRVAAQLHYQPGYPKEMSVWPIIMSSYAEQSVETQPSPALLNHQTEWPTQWQLCANNIDQYEVADNGQQSQLMQSMTTFTPQPLQPQPSSQQLISNSTDNQGHQLNGGNQQQQQQNTALANSNIQQQPQFVPHKKKTTIPRPMFDIINCLCCGIEYDSSSELSTHMHRQHPQLFGKCGQFGCGRSFPDFSYLMEHFNDHHPQAMMKFMCHLCGATFTTTNALNTHFLYYHHSGRFLCTQVGCSYVDEYQYKVQQHYYIEHVGQEMENLDYLSH